MPGNQPPLLIIKAIEPVTVLLVIGLLQNRQIVFDRMQVIRTADHPDRYCDPGCFSRFRKRLPCAD